MKGVILLLVFFVSGFVCLSQTHREDSILIAHKIDSLIEAKTKAHYNNKFFTLEDTVFEVGQVILPRVLLSYRGEPLEECVICDSIKKFFIKNFNLFVEIQSHTDYRGGEQFNLKLTDRRALIFKDYLTKDSLISVERVSYKGYGENQPIIEQSLIDCYSEQWIKEKFHAANRRTVFRITKVD
jgi:hypothetical protein